jgi:hypothetical protein
MHAPDPSDRRVQQGALAGQALPSVHRFAQTFWTVSSTQTEPRSQVGGQFAPSPTPGVRAEKGEGNPTLPLLLATPDELLLELVPSSPRGGLVWSSPLASARSGKPGVRPPQLAAAVARARQRAEVSGLMGWEMAGLDL